MGSALQEGRGQSGAPPGRKFPVANPRVAWRSLGDEVVIITPDDSILYALNPTGSFIWQHATGQRSLDEIVSALCEEFDAAPEAAAADAAEFVQSLCAKNLLQVLEQPRKEPPNG